MSIEITEERIGRLKKHAVDSVGAAIMARLCNGPTAELEHRDIQDMLTVMGHTVLEQFCGWCNAELRLIEADMEKQLRIEMMRNPRPIVVDPKPDFDL